VLKKIIFQLTICYTLFLATVSLIRLNDLPDLKISFADKIFHFIVYAGLTILWFYTFFIKFEKQFKTSIKYAVSFSVILGIIIEVLQGIMTSIFILATLINITIYGTKEKP